MFMPVLCKFVLQRCGREWKFGRNKRPLLVAENCGVIKCVFIVLSEHVWCWNVTGVCFFSIHIWRHKARGDMFSKFNGKCKKVRLDHRLSIVTRWLTLRSKISLTAFKSTRSDHRYMRPNIIYFLENIVYWLAWHDIWKRRTFFSVYLQVELPRYHHGEMEILWSSSDMCQDPHHLFRWIQILTKIRRMQHFFYCSVLRWYPSVTSASILSFISPTFWEKCQRSCQDPGTLDQRSEGVFPIFFGFKSFHQRKILTI